MNISCEIFTTDRFNFSDDHFCNSIKEDTGFIVTAVNTIIILLGFPINSYVILLIVTGKGNGLAAEFFSLNLAACEMFFCLESLVNLINSKYKHDCIVALFFNSLGVTGRPLFQCLIYVERYLAVVHPVTFLKYKPLRYKVICSVIAWLYSFISGGTCIMTGFLFQSDLYNFFFMVHFSFFFSIQLFCIVAFLRALKQSGPGERKRVEENHTKRRAFIIILITTVAMLIILFVHFLLNILSSLLHNGKTLKHIGFFPLVLAGLVQPLLFLYRVG